MKEYFSPGHPEALIAKYSLSSTKQPLTETVGSAVVAVVYGFTPGPWLARFRAVLYLYLFIYLKDRAH